MSYEEAKKVKYPHDGVITAEIIEALKVCRGHDHLWEEVEIDGVDAAFFAPMPKESTTHKTFFGFKAGQKDMIVSGIGRNDWTDEEKERAKADLKVVYNQRT